MIFRLTFWIVLCLSVKFGFTASLVEAQEGGNTVFQCQVPDHTNLENSTIDIKRMDANFSDSNRLLYSRRGGQDHPHPQSDCYRNRTLLHHGDLKVGLLTLVLLSVKLSDAGEYSVNIPHPAHSCFYTLRVNKTQRPETQTEGRREEGVDPDEGTKRHRVVSVVVAAALVMAIIGLMMWSMKHEAQRIQRRRPEQEGLRMEASPAAAANGSVHVQLEVE